MAVVGYLLRPTVLIPFIAIIICLFIVRRKVFISKKVLFEGILIAFVMLLTAVGSYIFLKKNISAYVTDDSGNFPATHWVMMGLHGDGLFSSTDEAFTASYETKEEKAKANIAEIKSTLLDYGVSGTVYLMSKKIVTTWSDGTGKYVTYTKQDRNLSKVWQWISGEKTDILVLYCQAFRIFSLMLALYSIYRQIKSRSINWRFLFTLSLCGGILFYMVWEAKASYSIPFLPILFILSADGVDLMSDSNVCKIGNLYRRKIGYALITITLFVALCYYHNFTEVPISSTSNTIYSYSPEFTRYNSTVSSESEQMIQEFYAEKEFNEIKIYCKKTSDADCEYRILLLNDENEILTKATVKSNDISDSWVTLSFTNVEPAERQKYKIVIESTDSGITDSIQWGYRFSKASSQYDGLCYINGKEQSYDLLIRVCKKYEAPYMGKAKYLIMITFILILEYGVFFEIRKKKGISLTTDFVKED